MTLPHTSEANVPRDNCVAHLHRPALILHCPCLLSGPFDRRFRNWDACIVMIIWSAWSWVPFTLCSFPGQILPMSPTMSPMNA